MNVGVLGGGQLGRMLALAGLPLGMRLRFYDVAEDAPAGHLAPLSIGAFTDHAALARFAEGLDVVTYEFENVPVESARVLAGHHPVYPPPGALEAAQDRVTEKRLFERLGIPTPRFAPVSSRQELDAALKVIGAPAVLKTRRLGYDGKGQAVLRSHEDAEQAWAALGGGSLILEQLVRFDRELSVLAVRGRSGETVTYPLVQNRHEGGILRESVAPAPEVGPALRKRAGEYARRVLEDLAYVGVLAIELFQVGDEVLANEMAPRVHNSGHWTIEGAATSQFENHLRAIAGWALGPAEAVGHSVMLNLIGAAPATEQLLRAAPGAHVHLYGKAPRAGRKIGHVTLNAASPEALAAPLGELVSLIGKTPAA